MVRDQKLGSLNEYEEYIPTNASTEQRDFVRSFEGTVEEFKDAWYSRFSHGQEDRDAEMDEWLKSMYNKKQKQGSANENTMRRSELKELVKEAYLEHLREEDDEDIEDEIEDDFEAEPAVAQDGESKNQESAPRKRINFENRELEMLVDVNKNATKKGIKIQFLSDEEFSKEERTKLVSSLQTYLDEGLAKFVKGAKLNIDSDPDVPNKNKTVGFTIKIGDVFGLVSKVFSNRGDDEEGGEEVEADETETEETEELQELRQRIRGFLK